MNTIPKLAGKAGIQRTKYFLFLLFACFFINSLNAQTPGLIVRDGAGNIPKQIVSAVLDPGGDGYTSATNAGFSGSDLGTNSQIVFRAIPVPTSEPGGDLRRGSQQRYSELVPDENNRSVYTAIVGGNLITRFRVGDIVNGAFGYSLLIDADGLFGPSDPTYSAANPGFEYELVYETGSRVAIYNVNSGTSSTLVQAYDLLTNPQYAQTSLALTTNGGNPDYFLDFYAPLSAFTGAGTINNSTILRFNATTVMSAQGAIFGPASDIIGDDSQYKNPVDQWYIGTLSQPPCTAAQLAAGTCPSTICTAAPALNTGITSTATSISGTWTKASYSAQTTASITVYKNGTTELGTVAGVTSGGSWTLNGVTGLADGDIITARAQASGETMCEISNSVVVSSCIPATTSACPVKTSNCDNQGFSGTGVAGATLRIYRISGTGKTTEFTLTIPAGGNWGWAGTGSTGNSANVCTGTTDVQGTYVITQQEPGKCESNGCTVISVGCTTTTATPVISTTSIFPSSTVLNGTSASGATVYLYINGVEKTTVTASGVNFSFNLSGYGINVGDVISVRAVDGISTTCLSAAASITVSCFVAPPVITNSAGQVVAGQSMAGTCSEIGATISIYNQATSALVGTTTVQANGTWTLATPTAVAGTTYYAVASRGCGVSVRSSSVTAANVTNVAQCGNITGPVAANATSVSGTLSSAVANTTVRLYIDGGFIGSTTTSTTSWTINTTSLYAGGVLQVGIQLPSSVEVLCPNTITVGCPSVAAPALSATSFNIAQTGTISIQVTNSLNGYLYTMEDAVSGTDYGTSAFGNNGTISLNSYAFNTPGTYNGVVKSINLSSSSCVQSSTFSILVVTPISGTVRKDANGLTDNTVNGTGSNAGGLYVNLVDGNNIVRGSVAVAADGTYSMNITDINSLTGPLRVRLSSTSQTVGSSTLASATLPSGWQSVGENFGTGTGSDGAVDGTLTIASTAVPLTNMNFGINNIPVTSPNIPAPTFNSTVSLTNQRFSLEPASLTPPSSDAMTASDDEDTNGNTVTTFNFRIDGLAGLAGKGKLYYDYGSGPVEITAPVTINNFDQSKLSFMWTINGAGATASFTFAAVDGAGTTGAARTYTINSLVTLPAIGLQLQASLSQGKALLQWETQTEVNTSFFTMQWSTDGVQFSNAGNRISAAGNSSNRRAYQGTIASLPAGKLYVRVMLTDKDGKVSYSNVVVIDNANAAPVVRLYPNPAKTQVIITGLGQAKELRVTNANGAMLTAIKVTSTQQVLNTAAWPAGMYNVQVLQGDGSITTLKLTKQ